jgi:hypothetical protein
MRYMYKPLFVFIVPIAMHNVVCLQAKRMYITGEGGQTSSGAIKPFRAIKAYIILCTSALSPNYKHIYIETASISRPIIIIIMRQFFQQQHEMHLYVAFAVSDRVILIPIGLIFGRPIFL